MRVCYKHIYFSDINIQKIFVSVSLMITLGSRGFVHCSLFFWVLLIEHTAYIHIYTHTYVHACIHTYTHTHTHTYICETRNTYIHFMSLANSLKAYLKSVWGYLYTIIYSEIFSKFQILLFLMFNFCNTVYFIIISALT